MQKKQVSTIAITVVIGTLRPTRTWTDRSLACQHSTKTFVLLMALPLVLPTTLSIPCFSPYSFNLSLCCLRDRINIYEWYRSFQNTTANTVLTPPATWNPGVAPRVSLLPSKPRVHLSLDLPKSPQTYTQASVGNDTPIVVAENLYELRIDPYGILAST